MTMLCAFYRGYAATCRVKTEEEIRALELEIDRMEWEDIPNEANQRNLSKSHYDALVEVLINEFGHRWDHWIFRTGMVANFNWGFV